jgi:hypothetical protein
MILDKINETPIEKRIIHIIPKGSRRIDHVIGTPENMITIASGITDKSKLIVDEKTFETGNIYFGT